MGSAIADAFDGDQSGQQVETQEDLFKMVENPNKPPAPVNPFEQAQDYANQRTSEDQVRRRASRTLFTGGFGALDRPTTASSVLLGS